MIQDDSWPEIKKTLNLCLDLPKDQRMAHLKQICGNDHHHERVAALLNADEEKLEFLERPLIRALEPGSSLKQYFGGDTRD